jgi:hypothetical protein
MPWILYFSYLIIIPHGFFPGVPGLAGLGRIFVVAGPDFKLLKNLH